MTSTRRAFVALALLMVVPGCGRAQSPEAAPDGIVRGPAVELHRYLEAAVEEGFSGAYLVARGGEIELLHGYGMADRENGLRYTAGTVFDIGSITKQFTAAAILKLEEAGRLRTSDPISSFFGPVPADKEAVTVHHLLTHGSGLAGDFGFDYAVMPRDSLVRLALGSRLQSEPGTSYSYSNAGYSLLGAIIEIVSGRPYEEYLYKQLFEPAGMQQTGYTIPDWSSAEVAVGYGDGARWGTPLDQRWAPDGPWWNLRANGGILSTLGDLHLWHRALEGDLVLSGESKDKLFAAHLAMNPDGTRHYGYGWMVLTTTRRTRLVAHSGGNPYFAADFRNYIDEETLILTASNGGPDTAARIHRGALGLVFDTAAPAPAPR
jgi:CubicO group peptidase (beta-lactamase class C family)